MQYAALLQLLAIVLPAILAFSTKIVSGNKRFLIAIIAYFILRKWAVQAAEDKTRGGIGEGVGGYLNPDALATAFRQAMNPSGVGWLMTSDGTDESELFELAARSRGMYKKVYDAYKTLYKSDLTADLNNELSPTEYKRFLQILNT